MITTCSMSAYGTCCDKATGLMHCLPFGHLLGEEKVPENIEVTLRGRCWYDGMLLYKTRVAEPYMTDLGERYAEVVDASLTLREQYLAAGLEAPRAWKGHDYGSVCRPQWQSHLKGQFVLWADIADPDKPSCHLAMVQLLGFRNFNTWILRCTSTILSALTGILTCLMTCAAPRALRSAMSCATLIRPGKM